MFEKPDTKNIPYIPPKEMGNKFTKEEIRKAIKSLKNNKNAGCDSLKAEYLKYGPDILHDEIANNFNEMAATGKTPEEINRGILVPLQKPGKSVSPPEHLRPIILLSILRKLLAICMIRRITEKIEQRILISQAAYRPDRSTTELIFTFKTLAEKAITSKDYSIHLLMLDMSKAFDTVLRFNLYEDLKTVLDDDELHIVCMMIREVTLLVRCGKIVGGKIATNIGVPQGDSLSPLLFTLYLSQALKPRPTEEDHPYTLPPIIEELNIPEHLRDHNYNIVKNETLDINQEYADDISFITNSLHKHEHRKTSVPKKLERRNLIVNTSKTEQFHIHRTGNDKCKICKLVGSIIDTENVIKRRKRLSMAALKKLHHIFCSKRTETEMKISTMNCYIKSIFLYNCEIWTTTKEIEKNIDVFQRNILRQILNIYWTDKINNKELYEISQTKP